MHPLIPIEGHRAGGKSRLGRLLELRISGDYFKTSEMIENAPSGAMNGYRAFMDANLAFSDEFTGEQPTIVNGYWATTLAAHTDLLGLRHGGLELPKGASERLYIPSAAILVSPDLGVVAERLDKRDEKDGKEYSTLHMIKTLTGLMHFYDDLHVPYTIIDTATLGEEKTLVAALDFIADYNVLERSPRLLSSAGARERWALQEASPEMTPEAQRLMKAQAIAKRRREGGTGSRPSFRR